MRLNIHSEAYSYLCLSTLEAVNPEMNTMPYGKKNYVVNMCYLFVDMLLKAPQSKFNVMPKLIGITSSSKLIFTS